MFGTVDRACNASNACEWFLLIEPSLPCTFYTDMDMMRGAIHLPPSPLSPRVVGARVHLLNSCPSSTLQSGGLQLLIRRATSCWSIYFVLMRFYYAKNSFTGQWQPWWTVTSPLSSKVLLKDTKTHCTHTPRDRST